MLKPASVSRRSRSIRLASCLSELKFMKVPQYKFHTDLVKFSRDVSFDCFAR